mmetsp:Transcript_33449/g.83979  ORF Transcript_33449/g.83979 Transcript_33449/m.83979 type:complete len:209 (-) Transcript_33449:16-642(-)
MRGVGTHAGLVVLVDVFGAVDGQLLVGVDSDEDVRRVGVDLIAVVANTQIVQQVRIVEVHHFGVVRHTVLRFGVDGPHLGAWHGLLLGFHLFIVHLVDHTLCKGFFLVRNPNFLSARRLPLLHTLGEWTDTLRDARRWRLVQRRRRCHGLTRREKELVQKKKKKEEERRRKKKTGLKKERKNTRCLKENESVRAMSSFFVCVCVCVCV